MTAWTAWWTAWSLRRRQPAARVSVGAVLLTVVLTIGASACGSSTPAQTAPGAPTPTVTGGTVILVAAGENFWGNITTQIGGAHVKVTSIISDPNTDPHEYESDARDAGAVAGAGLVIVNGAGYDDFLSKLLSTGGKHGRTVLTVSSVLGIGGSNPNPHLWYDTADLPTVAAAIAADLASLDPADAATFRTNAAHFDASLAPLNAVIAQIRTGYAGTKIAYTERVPGYLVAAAGLVLGTPATFSQAIEDGTDPSAADTAAFDADLSAHRVKVLLYNAQVTDASTTDIKSLARSAGIPIVGVTETLPPSYPSFQAWQLAQDQALLAALGG